MNWTSSCTSNTTTAIKTSWVPVAIGVVMDTSMRVHWQWERKAASRWDIEAIFYNLVTSKVELIGKVLPLAMIWTRFEGVTRKNNRRPTLVSNHGFLKSWYDLLYPQCRLCAPVKGRGGEMAILIIVSKTLFSGTKRFIIHSTTLCHSETCLECFSVFYFIFILC